MPPLTPQEIATYNAIRNALPSITTGHGQLSFDGWRNAAIVTSALADPMIVELRALLTTIFRTGGPAATLCGRQLLLLLHAISPQTQNQPEATAQHSERLWSSMRHVADSSTTMANMRASLPTMSWVHCQSHAQDLLLRDEHVEDQVD